MSSTTTTTQPGGTTAAQPVRTASRASGITNDNAALAVRTAIKAGEKIAANHNESFAA